jgi:hypothetical protein
MFRVQYFRYAHFQLRFYKLCLVTVSVKLTTRMKDAREKKLNGHLSRLACLSRRKGHYTNDCTLRKKCVGYNTKRKVTRDFYDLVLVTPAIRTAIAVVTKQESGTLL